MAALPSDLLRNLSKGEYIGYVVPGLIAIAVIALLLVEFPVSFVSSLVARVRSLPFVSELAADGVFLVLLILAAYAIGRFSHEASRWINILYNLTYPEDEDPFFKRAREKLRRSEPTTKDSSVYSLAAESISSNPEIKERVETMEGLWKIFRSATMYLFVGLLALIIVQIKLHTTDYIYWTFACLVLMIFSGQTFLRIRRETGGYVYQTYAPLGDS
jgi:hypothetical protein